ncbi:TonB-dependent receptor plug domain-containing protein [Pseudomonadota bacterium]
MKSTSRYLDMPSSNKLFRNALFCFFISLSHQAVSQETDEALEDAVVDQSIDAGGWGVEEDDPLMMYGDEDMLSLATGFTQPIAKAPSTATVITAKDIEAMGATTLREALETVPGLHISRHAHGQFPLYTFRGIYSNSAAQVLVMINSIPTNTLFVGSSGNYSGFLPVETIARIEVIRGPGSAIYGADAVAGVINIVTKSANDWRGTTVGGRMGSFDTQEAWVSHGAKKGEYDISLFLSAKKSDGHRRIIEADAQTINDVADSTTASHTPGAANTSYRSLDLRTDFSRADWRFRVGMQRLSNMGDYIAAGESLDPTDRWASDKVNADLTWHDADFYEHLDLKATISYYSTSQEIDGNQYMHVVPAGAKVASLFLVPDGLIGNPQYKDRYGRISIVAAYDGVDNHRVSLGLGYNKGELHDVFQTKNSGGNPLLGQTNGTFCSFGNSFCLPVAANSPIFSVTDYPDLVYLDEGARHNRYLYLQDIWSFLHDWELTAGVRADHYSDYGSTYNPRIALVWAAQFDLNVKLLYGRAFRGPTFGETFTKNNPSVAGNSDLNPETIETWELAFDYMPVEAPHWQLSFFRYDWDAIIQLLPTGVGALDQYQNFGNQTGHGMELAVEWEASRKLELEGNFSLQQSKNVTTATDSGNAPHWQLYVRADWQFREQWYFNTQINRVGDRRRALITGETREPLNGFTTVDVTLRRKQLLNNWEIAASIRNLFDDDVREPSTSPVNLPNDLPSAGRSTYLEARYDFQ